MPSFKLSTIFATLAFAFALFAAPSFEQKLFGVDIGGTFECISKITSAIGQCESRLQERLDLVDKTSKQAGEDIDTTMFSCCYFAEFSHCLDSKTEGKCGSDISSTIAKSASSVAKTLNSKCEGYEYYSATCLTVVYLNYIVIAVVVLALISVASCVIGCLRRR